MASQRFDTQKRRSVEYADVRAERSAVLFKREIHLCHIKQSLIVLLFLFLSCTRVAAQTYSTNFPLAENPISENGNWINGKSVGLDWADVSTTPGLAIGLQSGGGGFDDATALLTGDWGPDQAAEATVYTVNQNDDYYEEVEIRLRSFISPHSNTGYEINFRCSRTSNAYMQIVRWNGPLGDFTYLINQSGAQYGVANGDVIRAAIIGNVITAYRNGVEVARVTDSTYTSGNPGMGFFLSGRGGVNGDYGFMSFAATGSAMPPPTPSPTPTPASGTTVSGGGGCFVAAAAYGSPLAPEVQRLREVRDRYLMSFRLGRHFVAAYYRMTPSLAAVIANSRPLRTFVRFALVPVLAWASLVLWSPILGLTAPLAGLCLLGSAAVTWRRYRRRSSPKILTAKHIATSK